MRVYLSIGSNLGNRFDYLESGCKAIEKFIGEIITSSSVYETKPWGFECEEPFLNQALEVECSLSPNDLLKKIHEIEKDHNRIRSGKGYTSRTLDIDILYYGDQLIVTRDLIIPHKLMHLRRFVLEPLVEIAPDSIHPLYLLSNKDLLQQSTDKMEVTRLSRAMCKMHQ